MKATHNFWQHRCPDDGQWMAFFDGEGKPAEREMLGAHLRQCGHCQAVFEEISDAVTFADAGLDLIHPLTVRARHWGRKAWVGAAAAAMLMAGLGLTVNGAGQKAVAAIGSLFQVKSIRSVGVTPAQVASLTRIATQGGKVTLAHYGSIKVAGPMQEAKVPVFKLSQYGMPNLWPSALGTSQQALVQTGLRVTLKLNVPHINQLISSQGGRYFFPMSVNQVPFTLSIPAEASIHQGAWTVDEVPQPTVAAPGQVPVKAIAKALENLPFLPPQLQAAVQEMANWRNTLIVPLPGNPQTVPVGGTQRIVDSNAQGTAAGEAWVQKNGLVVAVLQHQSTPINRAAFQAEVARLFP